MALLSQSRATASSFFEVFRDHTQQHTTVGRTPLDERSARRRDLYLTAHNTHNRHKTCPRRDSNPQSQQASGCRPTHWSTYINIQIWCTVHTTSNCLLWMSYFIRCMSLHWVDLWTSGILQSVVYDLETSTMGRPSHERGCFTAGKKWSILFTIRNSMKLKVVDVFSSSYDLSWKINNAGYTFYKINSGVKWNGKQSPQ